MYRRDLGRDQRAARVVWAEVDWEGVRVEHLADVQPTRKEPGVNTGLLVRCWPRPEGTSTFLEPLAKTSLMGMSSDLYE